MRSWSSSCGNRKSAGGSCWRGARVRVTGPPRSGFQNANAKTIMLVTQTCPAPSSNWPALLGVAMDQLVDQQYDGDGVGKHDQQHQADREQP